MNETLCSNWNEAAGSWFAATKKSSGKSSSKSERSRTFLASGTLTGVASGMLLMASAPASASIVCLSDAGGTHNLSSAGSIVVGCSSWVTGLSGPYAVLDSGSPAGRAALALTSGQATFYLDNAGSLTSNLLTLTASGSNVAMTGLAPGSLSSTSLDGINGSQLYTTGTSTAAALGTTFNGSTGNVAAPSYALTKANQIANTSGAATDVGAGFSKVDAALGALSMSVAGNTTLIDDITNQINNGTIGLVQQDQTTKNITVAKNTDGATVDFTGTAGARVVDGVANGVVKPASKQAVNGSQLYALADATAFAMGGGSAVNPDGSITAPTYVIHNADGSTSAVNNVGDAISNIDGRTTRNSSDITNLRQQVNIGGIGLVQQDSVSHSINVGANTDGSFVNFAGLAGARVLDGVANGAVTSTSRQAVNGSQLHALSSSTASALGGGSTVNSDGSITEPTYRVNGRIVNNVGDAVSSLDTRVTQNTNEISNLSSNVAQNTADITNLTTDIANHSTQIQKNASDIADINNQINSGSIGLVQQDQTTRTVAVAKNADETVVDMTGTQGARKVAGVAAGTLSADSTDAVNGSQLYATDLEVSSLKQRVVNIQSTGNELMASQAHDAPPLASGDRSTAIGNGAVASGANSVALGDSSVAEENHTVSIGSAGNERRLTNVAPGINGTDAANMNQLNAVQSSVNSVARGAFAGVAAAMSMPNMTPSQPGNTVVAAGVGNYKGYTAVGLGATYRSRDSRWLVNGAASITPSGDTGARAQVGYEF
ncbi:YadA-like family protein [Caballeronia sp. NK8]|uniref:YadA family autotransporter adhesin n=1 Tax=Caballeronia sp. NK8 TaxID=140098 RepID=UPI001BCFEF3A|nr:YadA-like family protein [Caballeronia sp. NK8]